MFLAIAFTMDEGRKLEFLHRYDRLGLDAEMNSLAARRRRGVRWNWVRSRRRWMRLPVTRL